MSWTAWIESEIDGIRDASRWREARTFDGCGPYGSIDGRPVVVFASNDYLGLSAHPRVRAAAVDAIERYGAGAGSSRLVTGTRSLHLELEGALAHWQRSERALVFPSGFAANLAVFSVLGTEGTTIFSDALNHASIIDGCRLAKARKQVYRHRDLDHLESLLRASAGRKIVASDVVFSMDGDIAPVAALSALCARHDALLVLDEAHAVLQAPSSSERCALVRVGTLSKTLGALGGWVAGSRALIELLRNRARSFMFTTALSPADTAAARAALEIATSDAGDALRERLRCAIGILRPGHDSPIVPFILGAERDALAAANRLVARGMYVPAIRPPSVAEGTARLRVSLSAAHSTEQVRRLKHELEQLPCPARDRVS